MVLGFKQKIGNWQTHFVEKILAGVDEHLAELYRPKLHTIRKGNRWKEGDMIHMATGVRTKKYNQFNVHYPDLQKVTCVQDISIRWTKEEGSDKTTPKVYIDGNLIKGVSKLTTLALNDGFDDLEGFYNWFNEDFYGQLIHWTPKGYNSKGEFVDLKSFEEERRVYHEKKIVMATKLFGVMIATCYALEKLTKHLETKKAK